MPHMGTGLRREDESRGIPANELMNLNTRSAIADQTPVSDRDTGRV